MPWPDGARAPSANAASPTSWSAKTGRAPADLGFAAQRYAQETLHMAAHHEDWRQGTMAYMAAQNITDTARGTGVAA